MIVELLFLAVVVFLFFFGLMFFGPFYFLGVLIAEGRGEKGLTGYLFQLFEFGERNLYPIVDCVE